MVPNSCSGVLLSPVSGKMRTSQLLYLMVEVGACHWNIVVRFEAGLEKLHNSAKSWTIFRKGRCVIELLLSWRCSYQLCLPCSVMFRVQFLLKGKLPCYVTLNSVAGALASINSSLSVAHNLG